jgi:hypothetical protein
MYHIQLRIAHRKRTHIILKLCRRDCLLTNKTCDPFFNLTHIKLYKVVDRLIINIREFVKAADTYLYHEVCLLFASICATKLCP